MQSAAIVIPNYNGEKFILATIRAVANGFPGAEILIVDDASTDNSVQLIEASGFHVIRRKSNGGFAAAVNTGLRHLRSVRAEFALICNSDLMLSPEECTAIGGALDAFSNPKCAVVGFIEKGAVQRKDLEPQSISGFLFWLRISVLDVTGYFDEQFHMYGEETDFFRRVVGAGWGITQSSVSVAHAAEKSAKSKYMNSWYAIRNCLLLEVKGRRPGRALRQAIALLLVIFHIRGDANDPSTRRVRRPGVIVGPLMVIGAFAYSAFRYLWLFGPNSAAHMPPGTGQQTDYYSRERRWPMQLGLKRGVRVLDVGCGSGVLGSYLKRELSANVTGIEMLPAHAAEAGLVLDKVICAKFEDVDATEYRLSFDYVIFSDSLEHLVDPQAALIEAAKVLRNDGALLISIPNVRNFRVTIPLVILGRFEYQSEGLLDRTHLRFFTLSSISKLLRECGFDVQQYAVDLPLHSKVGWVNILTLGLFSQTLTSHFFIKACKRNF